MAALTAIGAYVIILSSLWQMITSCFCTSLYFAPQSIWSCFSGSRGLHCCNPLYCHSGWEVLIVDFDNDAPVSLRLFLTWLDVVRLFLLTKERILWSSFLFSGLSGLVVLLSWPVHSFFSGMYWIVDLATPDLLLQRTNISLDLNVPMDS